MRYRHAIFALVIVAATLSQTGCKGFSPSGGSGSAVTEGVGSGSLYIYTHLSSGIWQNAAVSGSANPATTLCFGTNDIKCSTSFPPVTDGSLGELIFSTDAIPGYWWKRRQSRSSRYQLRWFRRNRYGGVAIQLHRHLCERSSAGEPSALFGGHHYQFDTTDQLRPYNGLVFR
jgi:hypothetical protein